MSRLGNATLGVGLLALACSPTRDLDLLPLDGPPAGGTPGAAGGSSNEAPRDVTRWPFASTSIWNVPIGAAADLVPASLAPATDRAFVANDVVVVMTPDAPEVDVFFNASPWVANADHCTIDGDLLFTVPVPATFVIGNRGVARPNLNASFLLRDRVTVRQSEPFYRCEVGAHGTAFLPAVEARLDGDGLAGATGGSRLSSLGGTLRLGELRAPGDHVRHALRLLVDAGANLFDCGGGVACHRWPATEANSYAEETYGGAVPALRIGALLALHRDQPLDALGLETGLARELAWTLQHFGAYVVNDAAWSVYSLGGELSPDGSFFDQVASDWGVDLRAVGVDDSPFARDMQRLMASLWVVDDNGAGTVGGGGERLHEPAPPLAP